MKDFKIQCSENPNDHATVEFSDDCVEMRTYEDGRHAGLYMTAATARDVGGRLIAWADSRVSAVTEIES